MVALVVFGVLAAIALSGVLFQIGQSQTIYCNDFEYITCAEDTGNPTQYIVPIQQIRQCSPGASRCEVEGASLSGVSVGENCYYGPLGIPSCERTISTCVGSCSLLPGQWIVNYGLTQLSFTEYNVKLFWCGKSPCSYAGAGIPVQGADGCAFTLGSVTSGNSGNPDDNLYTRFYDDNFNVIQESTIYYTVPKGRSYLYTTYNLRRECGNTGESCSSNSDCAGIHTYSIEYGGDTYGVEFQSGQMIFYGCQSTGQVCLEKDSLPVVGEQCAFYTNERSFCAAVTLTGVQCIPGSDTCPAGMGCKMITPTQYECRPIETVECGPSAGCTSLNCDYQCGQAQTCDRVNKELVRPICDETAGTCGEERTSVDCCYDMDCADGYFCNEYYECEVSQQQKPDCPYSCCVDEFNYFDKPCSTDAPFCCGDHTCAVSQEACDVPPPNGGGLGGLDLNLILIAIVALVAIIGVSAVVKALRK